MGVLPFSVASVWCGRSRTIRELIAARALQGIGGALRPLPALDGPKTLVLRPQFRGVQYFPIDIQALRISRHIERYQAKKGIPVTFSL